MRRQRLLDSRFPKHLSLPLQRWKKKKHVLLVCSDKGLRDVRLFCFRHYLLLRAARKVLPTLEGELIITCCFMYFA